MIISGERVDGRLVVSRVRSPAVASGLVGITADRIGQECVLGIPCRQLAAGKQVNRYFIEPGFPHIDLHGRKETLRPRCWRLYLYHCARHDGTRYILPEPVIIGPTKTPPDFPVARPYVSCCWDFSGSKVVDFNSSAVGTGMTTSPRSTGSTIYFGRATRDGVHGPELTGERLFEIIGDAWEDCDCARSAFTSVVPAECPHDLMLVQIVYVLRRADGSTGGQPEYVDTEIRDIHIDRGDSTPLGS